MSESTQKKLDRIRPPRVQITYDVHIGNATEKKELPLLMGILADLSGKPAEPLPKVKDRKFVEIDRDNFNDVLAASGPRLAFQVENKLQDDGSKMNVLLNFREIDDFGPVAVIKQVPALARLLEARQRLSDLLGKLDGNDELGSILNDVVANTEQQTELKGLLGSSDPTPADA
ncbi:type VI secretion system contractile sheath small subunit [Arenibaculum pallidiluteum]|uniref:type VI secretion system contractile sheath small subunit n=1 Tax=Arenibaculum pallidiluteum TaxID=2812559 RepID=UPI001A95656E|nr:type VI secretion system contractile sheath small subunit [Arenibaculum pallidiluteum]